MELKELVENIRQTGMSALELSDSYSIKSRYMNRLREAVMIDSDVPGLNALGILMLFAEAHVSPPTLVRTNFNILFVSINQQRDGSFRVEKGGVSEMNALDVKLPLSELVNTNMFKYVCKHYSTECSLWDEIIKEINSAALALAAINPIKEQE